MFFNIISTTNTIYKFVVKNFNFYAFLKSNNFSA